MDRISKNFKKYLVTETTTIHEALNKIGDIEEKTLIVVDEKKFKGVLTQGDLRRYLSKTDFFDKFLILSEFILSRI